MYVCVYVRMYVCMYACMHGCMDAWMHGCMDAWMDGWMDGWMDVMYACMQFNLSAGNGRYVGVDIRNMYILPRGVDPDPRADVSAASASEVLLDRMAGEIAGAMRESD